MKKHPVTPLEPLPFLAKGVGQRHVWAEAGWGVGCGGEAALDLQRDSGPKPTLLSGHVDGVEGAESRLGGRTPAVLSLPLTVPKDMSMGLSNPL